jgi:hypothetical protein
MNNREKLSVRVSGTVVIVRRIDRLLILLFLGCELNFWDARLFNEYLSKYLKSKVQDSQLVSR